MDELENYYSGDSAWNTFSYVFDEFRTRPEVHSLTKTLGGRLDLACVIYGKVGSGYPQWLSKHIPALGNLTPLQCLGDAALLNRLREMLMRMPC
jgi:hypothetical protein